MIFLRKDLFSFICAQHVLSHHLIRVPWYRHHSSSCSDSTRQFREISPVIYQNTSTHIYKFFLAVRRKIIYKDDEIIYIYTFESYGQFVLVSSKSEICVELCFCIYISMNPCPSLSVSMSLYVCLSVTVSLCLSQSQSLFGFLTNHSHTNLLCFLHF